MTLEQVKKDIKNKKSKMIYYSTRTLWWTHLDEDVTEAMEFGKVFNEKRHKDFMSNPNIPEEEKIRMKSLFEMASKSHSIPFDPIGNNLFQMDDCAKWINEAENKPKHFGENGLEAFMKAHHQNCEGNCFREWESYNRLLG